MERGRDTAAATAASLQSPGQSSCWEHPGAPSGCTGLWLDTSPAVRVLPSRSWDAGLGSRGTARGSAWPGQAVPWITVAYQWTSPRLGARGCFSSLGTHRRVSVSVCLCARIAVQTRTCACAEQRGLCRIALFSTSSRTSPKKSGLGEFRNCNSVSWRFSLRFSFFFQYFT